MPRPRKTRQQLEMQGTFRADRHAGRNTPTFTTGAKCPAYLSREAKAEWRRVAPELEAQGLLTSGSAQVLASYCSSFAHWRESEQAMQRDGLVILTKSTTRTGETIKPVPNPAVRNYQTFKRLMLEAASRFGLDPLSRRYRHVTLL